MKAKIWNFVKVAAGALLGGLGFGGVSGCTPCEYGCPTATYKCNGTVRDESGKPIGNIQVQLDVRSRFADRNDRHAVEQVRTDEDGRYHLVGYDTGTPVDGLYSLQFNDVDGPENGGEFESYTDSSLVFRQSEGAHGWNQGEFETEVDVELKKTGQDNS